MFCGLVRQCRSITQFLMKASTIRCALKILGVSYLVVSINGDLNLADVLGETHTPQHPHTLLKLSLQAHLRWYYSYYSLKLYCLNILPWKWQETSDLKSDLVLGSCRRKGNRKPSGTQTFEQRVYLSHITMPTKSFLCFMTPHFPHQQKAGILHWCHMVSFHITGFGLMKNGLRYHVLV